MVETAESTRWSLNALRQLGGLAGTLGLILYGVLRLDHALFYGQLGVKPEEVGLGYAEILSQSVTGVVLVGCFFFAMIAVFAFFYGLIVADVGRAVRGLRLRHKADSAVSPMGAVEQPESSASSRLLTARNVLAVAILIVFGIGAWWLVSHVPDVASTVVAAAVIIATYVQVARTELSDPNSFLRRRWRALALTSAAISTVFVLALLSLVAWEQGRSVQRGIAVAPTFGPIVVAGWGAEFATITTTPGADDSSEQAKEKRCLMYLGEAKGKAVFYDPKGRQSLRIPSSGSTITVYHPPSKAPSSCRFGDSR